MKTAEIIPHLQIISFCHLNSLNRIFGDQKITVQKIFKNIVNYILFIILKKRNKRIFRITWWL